MCAEVEGFQFSLFGQASSHGGTPAATSYTGGWSKTLKRAKVVVSPDAPSKTVFHGKPPNGSKWWSRNAIYAALLACDRKEKAFRVAAILASKKTNYHDSSGIYKMIKKAERERGGGKPKSIGRPRTMTTEETSAFATSKMAEGSRKAVKLGDVMEEMENKKKEAASAAGLDMDTVDCSVSEKTAKIATVAAAMMNEVAFSQKKLFKTTETRHIAKTSFCAAYAYASTVLATHFIAGPTPKEIKDVGYNPSMMNEKVLNTINWAAEAYGGNNVYPVNPNLFLSTDDTTVFVGKAEDGSDWS